MLKRMCEPYQTEFEFVKKKEIKQPPLPKTDNDQLLFWQYEYLAKNDKTALGKMYELGKLIAGKMITEKAKKYPKVGLLSGEIKEEKAHNASEYIIRQYLERKDFIITKSYTAYIYLRVQHELFHRTWEEKNVKSYDIDDLHKIFSDNDYIHI